MHGQGPIRRVWRRCPRLYCPDAVRNSGFFSASFRCRKFSSSGDAEGLFQAERHSGRIVVRISIQSHAATLCKGKVLFNVMANGSKLVALHRHTVGVGMKQGGIALPLRVVPSAGKQYPYLGTPSAGTAESGKGLWQQGGLLLYIFRFGNARQRFTSSCTSPL